MKYCLYCDEPLTRKTQENNDQWLRRKYCNRSHARLGKGFPMPKKVKEVDYAERSGVKVYKRGDPGFAEIEREYR